MTYRLVDKSGRKGDSGGMSLAIWYDAEANQYQIEKDARPRVGVQMRVGSITARSYQDQDWWQTTDVLEILEESEHMVKFRTKNSVYTWETR